MQTYSFKKYMIGNAVSFVLHAGVNVHILNK